MKAAIITVLGAVLILSISSEVVGEAEHPPLDKLVGQHDTIIVGEITKITRSRRGKVALIKVEETLKGKKDLSKASIFISYNLEVGPAESLHESGQEGVWLLNVPKKGRYYSADYAWQFQPMVNLERIRSVIERENEQPLLVLELDPWKKRVIDQWIIDNDLNRYGDPRDTAYMGGTPLFDETTGKYLDRYEYIYLNHPEVRKLLTKRSTTTDDFHKTPAISDEIKKRIDAWIDKNGLNQYGDPKATIYTGGTPLFDEKSGKRTERYEYILRNHPELLEQLEL